MVLYWSCLRYNFDTGLFCQMENIDESFSKLELYKTEEGVNPANWYGWHLLGWS